MKQTRITQIETQTKDTNTVVSVYRRYIGDHARGCVRCYRVTPSSFVRLLAAVHQPRETRLYWYD